MGTIREVVGDQASPRMDGLFTEGPLLAPKLSTTANLATCWLGPS